MFGLCEAGGFYVPQLTRDLKRLLLSEQHGIEAPDVVAQPRTQHIGRHGGLEITLANEENDRMKKSPV